MTSQRPVAGWLIAAGAIVMLAASVFTWATVSGPAASVTVNGFNNDGYITDGFAVVFLILAFTIIRGRRRWLSVVSTLLTVVGVGWMLIVLAAINNFSTLYPDTTSEGVTVALGPGVIIALLGAALGLVGAVLSFFAPRATAAAPPPLPSSAAAR